jgi:hypothetical protein
MESYDLRWSDINLTVCGAARWRALVDILPPFYKKAHKFGQKSNHVIFN